MDKINVQCPRVISEENENMPGKRSAELKVLIELFMESEPRVFTPSEGESRESVCFSVFIKFLLGSPRGLL